MTLLFCFVNNIMWNVIIFYDFWLTRLTITRYDYDKVKFSDSIIILTNYDFHQDLNLDLSHLQWTCYQLHHGSWGLVLDYKNISKFHVGILLPIWESALKSFIKQKQRYESGKYITCLTPEAWTNQFLICGIYS